jgi:hypothetical protein
MRSYLYSVLLCIALAFKPTPAHADFGEANQILGTVLVVAGTILGNPALVNAGYGFIAAGPATYGLAARRRKKRRAPAACKSSEVRS